MIHKFNIRVYGICFNEKGEVLVAHETRKIGQMTKFPGGGLEWGEGLVDGLKREFKEELNWEIDVWEVIYLTDFFQESSFNPNDQVISVYYKVSALNPLSFPDFPNPDEYIEFEWKSPEVLREEDFTFPIDRIVVSRLRQF
jgi:8-oxo-dGTP diphosphatase